MVKVLNNPADLQDKNKKINNRLKNYYMIMILFIMIKNNNLNL